MPYDIFIEIIHTNIFLLFLAMGLYTAGFLVTFKLSYAIIGLDTDFKKIYPTIAVMLIYSLFAKWIIAEFYGLITAILVCVSLIIVWKAKILEAAWASVITTIISAMGAIIFFFPVAAIDNRIADYLLKSAQGHIISAFIELLLPAIAVFILPKLKISLIPPLIKNMKINIFGFMAYGGVYWLVFNSTMQLFLILKTGSGGNVSQAFISQFAALFIAIVGYYKYISDIKKVHKRELEQLEEKILRLQQESTSLNDLNLQIENNSLDTPAAIAALQSIIRNQMLHATANLKELSMLNAEVENKKRNLKRIK